MKPLRCAEGIVAVSNSEMIRALRVVTVQRGIDPRRYALLAFGGAGPLHAAAIARELGITRIVCPRASGVLSALGLVVSPRRRDVQRSVLLTGDELTAQAIADVVALLGEQAAGELGETPAELRATYELRYRGQAFELPVAGSLTPSPAELRTGFEALHEERYGYSDPEQQLELVTVRVSATVPGADVALSGPEAADGVFAEQRRATLDGTQVELDVLRGAPPAGTQIAGPAVVELAESTLLVRPGWTARADPQGTIHLTYAGGAGP
jgi:N-methylhydantoinase A